MKKDFIVDRVQELNLFFKFIVDQPQLFNIGGLSRPGVRLP